MKGCCFRAADCKSDTPSLHTDIPYIDVDREHASQTCFDVRSKFSEDWCYSEYSKSAASLTLTHSHIPTQCLFDSHLKY